MYSIPGIIYNTQEDFDKAIEIARQSEREQLAKQLIEAMPDRAEEIKRIAGGTV